MYIYENKEAFSREKPFVFHTNKIDEKGICVNWHENIELLYVAKGKGRVFLENVSYEIESGKIAVVNSFHLHNIIADKEIESHCLIIDEDFLAGLKLAAKKVLFEGVIENENIVKSFERIADECSNKDKHYIAQVRAEVINVMVELHRNHLVEYVKDRHMPEDKKLDKVKRIIEYLNGHYREDIDVDKMSKEFGYSKYYITHLFKEMVKCPIIQYINELRCRHAKIALAEGDLSVEEVARVYGFGSQSYFTKIYKKYIGELPSDTKKQKSAKN